MYTNQCESSPNPDTVASARSQYTNVCLFRVSYCVFKLATLPQYTPPPLFFFYMFFLEVVWYAYLSDARTEVNLINHLFLS